MTTPDAVKAGIAALNRLLAGQTVSTGDQEALDFLQSVVGARKPLREYAPRTRRRYLAAAEKGQSASEANKAEYSKRKAKVKPSGRGQRKPTKRKMRQEMEQLVERRNEMLPGSVVDWEVVDDFILAFGHEHVLQILRNEIDSIEHYVSMHDKEPGNRRWHSRVEEVYQPDFNARLANTDILYYYHGVRL